MLARVLACDGDCRYQCSEKSRNTKKICSLCSWEIGDMLAHKAQSKDAITPNIQRLVVVNPTCTSHLPWPGLLFASCPFRLTAIGVFYSTSSFLSLTTKNRGANPRVSASFSPYTAAGVGTEGVRTGDGRSLRDSGVL